METQSRLKLNVRTIRSVLISGKKQEDRISSQKTSLIRKEQQKQNRREREFSLEKIRIPLLGGAVGAIGGATAGIRSGIGGFLTNILLGFIIKNLPKLIKKVKELYKKVEPFIKGTFEAFEYIFDGAKFIWDKVTWLNDAIKDSGAYKLAETQFKFISQSLGSLLIDGERNLKDFAKEIGQSLPEANGSVPLYAGGGAAGMMSGMGTNSSPQSRNTGGQILNTMQPRLQDHRDDMHRMNPIRLFPRVTNKNTRNNRAYSKNIENFADLVRILSITSTMNKTSPTSSGTGSGTGMTSSLLGSGGGSLSGLSDEDWKYLGFVVSAEAERGTADEYGVAASVLNRVASKDFPNTIKGVVFQAKQYEAVYKGLSRHDPELVAKLRSAEGQGKIVEALKTLQGRTDFKGTSQYANYVPGEDIKFSSRGNFYHYSWQTGRNSVKPVGFADVDYMRFIKARDLTPNGRNNSNTNVIIQPVEVEKIRYINPQQKRKGIQGQVRSNTLNSTGNYHDFR